MADKTTSDTILDNNSNLIIHIGLHKTGTTYLQEVIFPQLKSVSLIRGWYSLRKIVNSCNKTRNAILISYEGLSGNPFCGSYMQDFYKKMKIIMKLFGNPKIVVGFRQQHTFIASLYKQYLHQGGFKSFSYLYNNENTGLIKDTDLKFRDRLMFLKDNFSNVFCYSLEQFSDSLPEFAKSLSTFLSIPYESNDMKFDDNQSNKGVSTNFQVSTLKLLNKINHQISQKTFIPSVYSDTIYGRVFRKLKITP